MFMRFVEDESGATMIEYGLIASMFGVMMIAAFSALKVEYISMYENIETVVVESNNP